MSKRFSKIYVEITNYCPLSCSFCSKTNLPRREMSVDEFNTVVQKIKDYTDSIYLHVKGEPLTHSHLEEILTICDNNKMKVRITTNGIFLEKEKYLLLRHHIKQINVSLHSEHKMKNYFSKVFAVCDELSRKTTIIYRIWTLPSLCLDKVSTNIVDKIIHHYHLSNEIIDKIKNAKNIKIQDNIYLDKDYEFEWPKINDNKGDYGTCLGTRNHIAILSNGDIVPCCLDCDGIIKLGNIFHNSIDDILNSDLFKLINSSFQNHKVVCELCKSCSYRLRFDKKKSE